MKRPRPDAGRLGRASYYAFTYLQDVEQGGTDSTWEKSLLPVPRRLLRANQRQTHTHTHPFFSSGKAQTPKRGGEESVQCAGATAAAAAAHAHYHSASRGLGFGGQLAFVTKRDQSHARSGPNRLAFHWSPAQRSPPLRPRDIHRRGREGTWLCHRQTVLKSLKG